MKKLKNSRKATITVLLTIIVGLIGYDIFIFAEPTDRDTISAVTLDYSIKHPAIPVAAGLLCGHLFWPANYSKKRKRNSLIGLIVGGVGVIALDAFGFLAGIPPIVSFIVGIIGGHFGWSQTKK